MTSIQYYTILKQLAETHTDLQHTDNQPHYFRGELEEFYMGLRNHVNYPAMIAEGFTITLDTSDPSSIWKRRETSFIIVKDYEDDNDYDQIDVAFNVCESIGDDVMRKLLQLNEVQQCPSMISNVTCQQLQNETDKYVGLRYTFTLSEPFDDEPNEEKWLI